MEVLHTSFLVKAKIDFEDTDLEDVDKRNSYAQRTPTTTLPFLETKEGNISESLSIETFLAKKFKPDLLGSSVFERAKVNQWIEFASCEIQKCLQDIIYPIFNWKEYNKELSDESNKKLKQYMIILEKELSKGNKYILGNKITLADVILFRYLRFFMMLHFTENIRNSLFPKLTKWFENIMNSPEAVEAYGRTILCKKQIKPLNIKFDKNKLSNEGKHGVKKEKNPLDSLPPSSFDLESFKQEFFEDKSNHKDKAMEKFWKELDERLELCFEAIMCRHYSLLGTISDASPIHWQYGGIARLKPGEKIDDLLRGGYSTISLGYVGLYELTKLMTGKSLATPEGHDFALKILKKLKENVDKWKTQTGVGFVLYATQSDKLCYRFARIDKEMFGTINDITDKGYYTNSYHIDRKEEIDVLQRLSYESDFQKISQGGGISYIEIPDIEKNVDKIENIIKYIYENVQFAEFTSNIT